MWVRTVIRSVKRSVIGSTHSSPSEPDGSGGVSCVIMMKKAKTGVKAEAKTFDITEQTLTAAYENFYFDRGHNAFVGLYEYSFRPEEYFSPLTVKHSEELGLCFATEWSMKTDDISMYYWGDFEESHAAGELEKILTEKEKTFFKGLMDQICMDKYGVLISPLHKPLTQKEEDMIHSLQKRMDDVPDSDGLPDSLLDEGPEDRGEGWLEGWEDGEDEENGEGIEFDVHIEMMIAFPFPHKHTPDIEIGMRDVSEAFEAADVGSWVYGADAKIDDGMLWVDFTTSVMADDSIDAENSCMKSMDQVKRILEKKGYHAENLSCTAKESY